jgi:hypothetical protein
MFDGKSLEYNEATRQQQQQYSVLTFSVVFQTIHFSWFSINSVLWGLLIKLFYDYLLVY